MIWRHLWVHISCALENHEYVVVIGNTGSSGQSLHIVMFSVVIEFDIEMTGLAGNDNIALLVALLFAN